MNKYEIKDQCVLVLFYDKIYLKTITSNKLYQFQFCMLTKSIYI